MGRIRSERFGEPMRLKKIFKPGIIRDEVYAAGMKCYNDALLCGGIPTTLDHSEYNFVFYAILSSDFGQEMVRSGGIDCKLLKLMFDTGADTRGKGLFEDLQVHEVNYFMNFVYRGKSCSFDICKYQRLIGLYLVASGHMMFEELGSLFPIERLATVDNQLTGYSQVLNLVLSKVKVQDFAKVETILRKKYGVS